MARGHSYPGLWINFESGEGGGKTTQSKLLAEYLSGKGYIVEVGREPGTTAAGEHIRKILQDSNLPELNPRTEMLLYVAAGIELFENRIKPSLMQEDIFISDRWRYSTKAYQGYGLGIDLGVIDNLIDFSCAGARPDLTFLLDIDARLGLQKSKGKNEFGKEDKIEARKLEYHQRVNQGYREIARQNSGTFRVVPYIDGQPDWMQFSIRKYVDEFIKENHLEPVLSRVSQ